MNQNVQQCVDWRTEEFLAELRQSEQELRVAHSEYTSTVSSVDMAASLQCCGLLRALLTTLRPEKVLNLGSGFSSYVLRRYGPDVGSHHIVCVDDDEDWLELTRNYLQGRQLDTVNTLSWTEFALHHAREEFDLVFYDLGRMPTRTLILPLATTWVRETTGLLILDDVHKPAYREAVSKSLNGICTIDDISDLTTDELGRFAWLATDFTRTSIGTG